MRPGSSQPYRGTSQRSQSFDSRGSGDRIRGNAAQIYERYLALAREAARTDDRVVSENYYQHAEHYFRIKNLGQAGNSAATPHSIDRVAGATDPAPGQQSEIGQAAIPEPRA
jgi:hypothetical protein